MEPTKEESLLSVLQGADAKQWAAQNFGWSNETDIQVCGWTGVMCDPMEDSIISINLANVGIDGTIPEALGDITTLQILNLSGNRLKNSVPIQVLDLPALVDVNLAMNQLTGTFPQFQSSVIERLLMQENSFNETLPDNIGLLNPSLRMIDISNNTFTGGIPGSVTQLSHLQILNLAFNELAGTIPQGISYLVELRNLILNHNHLLGTIPHAIHQAHSLERLHIQFNDLSGTIPEPVSELPNLFEFLVNGNKLSGTVPIELCQRDFNVVYFLNMPPELAPHQPPRNGCNSIACPINWESPNGIFPCTLCPEGKFTPYVGWAEGCVAVHEKDILDTFHLETNGAHWLGGERWGNPNVPVCLYEGVDCNENGNVVNITLKAMNLNGSIPGSLGHLKHLQRLVLPDNLLTGRLPSELRHPPLEELDVTGNLLEGPLPPLLCLTDGINGNGENGDFRCGVIACPEMTFFKTGRALNSRSFCTYCPSNTRLIGQKTCAQGAYLMENIKQFTQGFNWAYIAGFLGVFVFGLVVILFWRMRRREDGIDAAYYEDGSHDSQLIGSYSVSHDELSSVSYQNQTGGPLTFQRIVSSRRLHQHGAPPPGTADTRVRHRRIPGPDDPDTQDLWLDVPKIA